MQGAPNKSGDKKIIKKVAMINGSLQELGRGRQMNQRGRKISASRGAPLINVMPALAIGRNQYSQSLNRQPAKFQ